jgi:SAP domain
MSSSRSKRKSVGAKPEGLELNNPEPVQIKKRSRMSYAPTSGTGKSSLSSSSEAIIDIDGIPIKDMKVEVLREHLKRFGKPVSGKKEELVASLLREINLFDDGSGSISTNLVVSAKKKVSKTPVKLRSPTPELPEETSNTPVASQLKNKASSRKSEVAFSAPATASTASTRASSRQSTSSASKTKESLETAPTENAVVKSSPQKKSRSKKSVSESPESTVSARKGKSSQIKSQVMPEKLSVEPATSKSPPRPPLPIRSQAPPVEKVSYASAASDATEGIEQEIRDTFEEDSENDQDDGDSDMEENSEDVVDSDMEDDNFDDDEVTDSDEYSGSNSKKEVVDLLSDSEGK